MNTDFNQISRRILQNKIQDEDYHILHKKYHAIAYGSLCEADIDDAFSDFFIKKLTKYYEKKQAGEVNPHDLPSFNAAGYLTRMMQNHIKDVFESTRTHTNIIKNSEDLKNPDSDDDENIIDTFKDNNENVELHILANDLYAHCKGKISDDEFCILLDIRNDTTEANDNYFKKRERIKNKFILLINEYNGLDYELCKKLFAILSQKLAK